MPTVGPHCSRPAYPRHLAQALHLSPPPGRGLVAKCLISIKFSSGGGFRAFDSRPVSCRVQSSVCLTPTGDEICLAPVRLIPQPSLVRECRHVRLTTQARSRRPPCGAFNFPPLPPRHPSRILRRRIRNMFGATKGRSTVTRSPVGWVERSETHRLNDLAAGLMMGFRPPSRASTHPTRLL